MATTASAAPHAYTDPNAIKVDSRLEKIVNAWTRLLSNKIYFKCGVTKKFEKTPFRMQKTGLKVFTVARVTQKQN
ncbi:MAG: hypothetical protein GY820_28175 [Gammaproteobacteria bacterium]|nr:hypothetical protein [Gammaproteobacteria bacterium]